MLHCFLDTSPTGGSGVQRAGGLTIRRWLVWGLALMFSGDTRGAEQTAATAGNVPLQWDAMAKVTEAHAGQETAEFEYAVENTSGGAIEITEVRTSCGCTVAELPRSPWILAAGEKSSFRATAEFAGKWGVFTKAIQVISSAGTQTLTLTVNIPETEATRRARNQQLALVDRQAVFRGDCAGCHVAPLAGKMGSELFQAACGICHASPHRASMVPDLAVGRTPRDASYWRTWISEGKEQTLMPAFAQAHRGPLTAAQIESLVAFALEKLPTNPTAKN